MLDQMDEMKNQLNRLKASQDGRLSQREAQNRDNRIASMQKTIDLCMAANSDSEQKLAQSEQKITELE